MAEPSLRTKTRRSWRLRALVYGFLGIALLPPIALSVYLRTESFQRMALQRVTAAVQEVLGHPVRLESLRIDLFPPGGVATGLVAEDGRLSVERVEVVLSLRDLFSRRITVEEVDVYRPAIRWAMDGGPLWRKREAAGGRPVRLERLRVHDGTIAIGSERRSFSADLEGLSVLATQDDDASSGPWDVTAVFESGTIRWEDLSLAGVEGALAFNATRDKLGVQRLRLRAEGIDIEGSGTVDSFAPSPRGAVTLRAALDPQSAHLTRPLRAVAAKTVGMDSTIEMTGGGIVAEGTWTADEPSFDMDRDAARDGPLAPVVGRSAQGTIRIAKGALDIASTIAMPDGGTAAMELHQEDKGEATQREIHVTLDDLAPEPFLALFDLPGRDEVIPAATVDGEGTIAWEGASTSGRLALAFSPRPGPDPLSGDARVRWNGRRITNETADLETTGSRVTLAGVIDARDEPSTIDLTCDLFSDDTAPLVDLIERRFRQPSPPDALRPPLQPRDARGRLEGRFVFGGTSRALHLEADLSSDWMTVSLPVQGDPARRVPLLLDWLEGHLLLDDGRMRITLGRAEGADVDLLGSVEMIPSTGTLVGLHLQPRMLSAEVAATLAGIEPGTVSLGGELSGSLTLARSERGALEGPLEIASDLVTVGPIEVTSLRGRGHLRHDRLDVEEASFEMLGGHVRADGSVPIDRWRADRGLTVTAEGIDLAAMDAAFGRSSLTGRVNVQGRLGFDQPIEIAGQIAGTGLTLQGVDLGDVEGPIRGTTGRLQLDIQHTSGSPSLSAVIMLDEDPPLLDATLQAQGFSLDRIRPVLPEGALPGLRGDADGLITVRGPLLSLRAVSARAVLDRINLTAGDFPLHNVGPVQLTLNEGFATLAPMRLVGDRTDLTVGGSVRLDGKYEATALVEGVSDLGLIEVVIPEMRAAGPSQVSLRITEHGDGIAYEGTLRIAEGRLAHPGLPMGITDLAATGRFTEGGVLAFDDLSFMVGGGRVTGTGHLTFVGASIPNARVDLIGPGIHSEIAQPGLRAVFDADVSLTKRGGEHRLAGRIDVQRAVYSRPFGLEPTQLLVRTREFAPSRPGGGEPAELILDVDVVADGGLWMRSESGLLEAEADLHLAGSTARPELTGNVTALEGGTFRFRDVNYRIVRGTLDFVQVDRIDPRNDMEAVTRVLDYEVTLRVTGNISRPDYDLTSDPPLSQSEVVWLLLTGQTPDEPGFAATQFTQAEVASYLAAPIAGVVTSPLEKLPGVTSVRIDPYFLEGTADPSARATVTSRLSQDLLFTYSTNLETSGQEVYQVEYNAGRLWDFIATRDDDGSVGGDVRFRRRWRGFNPFSVETEEIPALPRLRAGRIAIVADHLPDNERALRRRIPFDEGDAYNRGDLLEGRENLRSYYARHGYPAAVVDVLEHPRDLLNPGRQNVTYTIRSGARHSIHVRSDVDERQIRKAVRRGWLDLILIDDLQEQARTSALEYLWGKGRWSAKVEATTSAPAPDHRVVSLEAAAGPKVKVRDVEIRGNKAISEERIRRQMLTKGPLRREILADDVAAIRSLYLSEGYLSVGIAEPQVMLSDDGDAATVIVTIDEGPQWRIGGVAIEGEAYGASAEYLIAASDLVAGQPLTAVTLNQSAEDVRLALDREGYAQARVTARMDGPPEAVRIVFTIRPETRARVASVTLEGNSRTRGRIVEREITLEQGDPLSRAEILKTQGNLYRLGTFRTVRIDTEPTAGDSELHNVKIIVSEGSPILTGWGVGYDSDDRLRGQIEVGHNNLFGTRRSAAIFVRGSSVDRRFQVTLRDPNLFGEKIETLWSGFVEDRETESFDERRLGVSAQLSRPVGERLRLFGNYRLEDVDLRNIEISPEEVEQDDVRLGSIAVSGVLDTRNDILAPTKGALSSLEVRLFETWLGGDESFLRLYGRYSRFVGIGEHLVWAWAFRAGTLTSVVPTSERFFAGGDTTIRGFDRDTVGPKDPNTNNPTGGNGVFIMNQELRFPVWRFLKGVVFYDAGNVYEDLGDYDPTDLRQVLGGGLRFDTPVGPFRIEYGHKLDREEDESPGKFYFSIGQAF